MAATHLDEVTGDLPPFGWDSDLIILSRMDNTLTVVWEWVRAVLVRLCQSVSGTAFVAFTVR